MADERRMVPGDVVRHFKAQWNTPEEDKEGRYLYRVLDVAKSTEDGRSMVVYKALYGDHGLYVRDLDEFMSRTDTGKYPDALQEYRFETLATISDEPDWLPREKMDAIKRMCAGLALIEAGVPMRGLVGSVYGLARDRVISDAQEEELYVTVDPLERFGGDPEQAWKSLDGRNLFMEVLG